MIRFMLICCVIQAMPSERDGHVFLSKPEIDAKLNLLIRSSQQIQAKVDNNEVLIGHVQRDVQGTNEVLRGTQKSLMKLEEQVAELQAQPRDRHATGRKKGNRRFSVNKNVVKVIRNEWDSMLVAPNPPAYLKVLCGRNFQDQFSSPAVQQLVEALQKKVSESEDSESDYRENIKYWYISHRRTHNEKAA
jgi:hypothetical protein